MRAKSIFLYASKVTSDGALSSISVSDLIDSGINSEGVVFSGLMLSGTLAATNDPYGNVEVSVATRTVTNGKISGLSFSKSEISRGTTDSGDLIVIASR